MNESIGRYWWVLLIQGMASFTYGVVAMSWPYLTVVLLISVFGAFSVFYGVAGIFRSQLRFRLQHRQSFLAPAIIKGLPCLSQDSARRIPLVQRLLALSLFHGSFRLENLLEPLLG